MRTLIDWLKDRGLEPRDIQLYYEACTHSSYANERQHNQQKLEDNERLEFVGDAVLQIWSATTLYKIHPKLKEGKMTTMRAKTVCESTLAKLNQQLGWYEFLRLGIGEEKSGGRQRPSILADHFEACIGAVYIDLGYSAVCTILDECMKPLLTSEQSDDVMDYKTQLQEYIQTDNRKTIQYRLLDESGPSNAPTFTMGVFLDDICMGKGQSSTKKKAEQQAAKEAFSKLAK